MFGRRDTQEREQAMSAQSRVWFITGASSGFGQALAEAVLKRGECAVLVARRAAPLDQLVAAHPDRAIAVPTDLLDPLQRARAIERAIAAFGRIDVLANIAGRGSLGAAEEFSEAELRAQMEINFFAAVGLTRAALPHLRAQGAGHILNLTSVGGIISVGGFSVYCASKYALEGWTEALSDELRPFGVRVTLAEPGNFRTEFAGDVNMRPAQPLAAYRSQIAPIEQFLYGQDGRQPGDPAKAAAAMIAAVESDKPPLRLLLGADAYAAWGAKSHVREAEFSAWRVVGTATSFDDVVFQPIPGA
jgi:NAD(P)-dependent dehydrogenase (short-subunit alcohol dehydrogenase family)